MTHIYILQTKTNNNYIYLYIPPPPRLLERSLIMIQTYGICSTRSETCFFFLTQHNIIEIYSGCFLYIQLVSLDCCSLSYDCSTYYLAISVYLNTQMFSSFFLSFFFLKLLQGTSLVVRWLRLCLPKQQVRVQSLVGDLRSYMPRGQKTKT